MPARFYDRRRAWRPFLDAIGGPSDPGKVRGHYSVPRAIRERMAARLHTAHAYMAAQYVLDRTFGEKEYRAHITQREFLYGRTRKNGKYQPGSGIKSFYMLRLALLECEEAGIIHRTQEGRGRGTCTWFEMILPDALPVEQPTPPSAPVKRSQASRPVPVPAMAAQAAPTPKSERPHMQRQMPAPIDDSPLVALLAPICEQYGDTNVADTLRYAREQGVGLDDEVLLDAAQKAIAHVEGAIKDRRADNPTGLLRYRIAHETANARKEQEARAAAQAERERQWAAILAIPFSEKAQRCEALLRERDWPGLAIPGMRVFSGEDDWQWLLHLNQDEALLDELLTRLAPNLPLSSAEHEQDRAAICDNPPVAIHEEPETTLETEALACVEDAPVSEEASATEPECLTTVSDLPMIQRPRRPLLPRWRQEQEALWKEAEEQNFPPIVISSDGEDWLEIAGTEGWQHFKETSSSFEQDRARIKLRQLRRSAPHLLLSLTAASGDSGERSGA